MAKAKSKVRVPKTASAGDIIKIKTLATHEMESGQRINEDGTIYPRMIINQFECKFNDVVVFSCDIGTAIATNPYIEFRMKVTESGTFHFRWIDDEGTVIETDASIEVS